MKETLKNVDELYDKINQLLKSYDLLKKNNNKILEDLNSVKISLLKKEDEIKMWTLSKSVDQMTKLEIVLSREAYWFKTGPWKFMWIRNFFQLLYYLHCTNTMLASLATRIWV